METLVTMQDFFIVLYDVLGDVFFFLKSRVCEMSYLATRVIEFTIIHVTPGLINLYTSCHLV